MKTRRLRPPPRTGGLSRTPRRTPPPVWRPPGPPEIAAIVCVTPAVAPPAPSFIDMMKGILESGTAVMPAIGNDIADPGGTELAYDGMPIEPLLSMVDAEREIF